MKNSKNDSITVSASRKIALLGTILCLGLGCCFVAAGTSERGTQAVQNQSSLLMKSQYTVDVYYYHSHEPAPMGIADYGMNPSDNTSYTYNTTSFQGTAVIDSILFTNGTNHGTGIQLNVVMKFTVGSIPYVYWLQDVAGLNTSTRNFFGFEDNVWNFSTPTATMSSTSISWTSAGGEFESGAYLGVSNSSEPGGDVFVTYPATIMLRINSTLNGSGKPVVDFSYNDGFGWQTYDRVTFLTGAGSITDSNLVVDGSQTTPREYLFYDAEFVFCGDGTSLTRDTSSNISVFLDYYNGHDFEGVPCAYDFGSNTAEAISNASVATQHTTSGQIYNELLAGPGTIGPSWNSSSTAIVSFVFVGFNGLQGGSLSVGGTVYSFSGTSAQITIWPGTYNVELNSTAINSITFYAGFNVITVYYGPPYNYTSVSSPEVPQHFQATPGNDKVVLTWTAPSTGANNGNITGYEVYRGSFPGGEELVANLSTVYTWTDTNVSNGLTYYYEVSAVNAAGAGVRSTEVSATPTIPLPVPGYPIAFTIGFVAIVGLFLAVKLDRKGQGGGKDLSP
jgi:hypothetical protein